MKTACEAVTPDDDRFVRGVVTTSRSVTIAATDVQGVRGVLCATAPVTMRNVALSPDSSRSFD